MIELDLATACPLDADERPRHRGLHTAGRLAAYEATAIGAAFGVWVLVDVALTQLATARGDVRRTIRGAR